MNIYYVYTHKDPYTKDIVYVGMGQKGRAWDMQTGSGAKRSREHFKWFTKLELKGYTMQDVVSIEVKRVSKEKAFESEKKLITLYKPTFNGVQGRKPTLRKSITDSVLLKRREGLTLTELSRLHNVSGGTIWRILKDSEDYKRIPKNQHTINV